MKMHLLKNEWRKLQMKDIYLKRRENTNQTTALRSEGTLLHMHVISYFKIPVRNWRLKKKLSWNFIKSLITHNKFSLPFHTSIVRLPRNFIESYNTVPFPEIYVGIIVLFHVRLQEENIAIWRLQIFQQCIVAVVRTWPNEK